MDERTQILRMVADGRITPEQADELLEVTAAAPVTSPKGAVLDGDDLILLKTVGAGPEDVRAYVEAGLYGVDVQEVASLATLGVGPEYVREMLELLGPDADLQTLMGMHALGVTPSYVRAVRDAGLEADAQKVQGMFAMGVDPADAASFSEALDTQGRE